MTHAWTGALGPKNLSLLLAAVKQKKAPTNMALLRQKTMPISTVVTAKPLAQKYQSWHQQSHCLADESARTAHLARREPRGCGGASTGCQPERVQELAQARVEVLKKKPSPSHHHRAEVARLDGARDTSCPVALHRTSVLDGEGPSSFQSGTKISSASGGA